jgi:hypothetical protein
VPHLLTTITEHQDVFVVILATILAWCIFLFLFGILEEHRWIDVGNLLTILDGIGGNGWTYVFVSINEMYIESTG